METSQSQSATPGKLVEFPTAAFSRYSYASSKYKLDIAQCSEEDTYITIFNLASYNYYDLKAGPGQNQDLFQEFKVHPRIKIIWESELAVNRRGGHGTFPRNKLVVWEVLPCEQEMNNVQNVQPSEETLEGTT